MEKNRTQFPFTTALRSNKLTSHEHNNKNKHYDGRHTVLGKSSSAPAHISLHLAGDTRGQKYKFQFGICSNRLDFVMFYRWVL